MFFFWGRCRRFQDLSEPGLGRKDVKGDRQLFHPAPAGRVLESRLGRVDWSSFSGPSAGFPAQGVLRFLTGLL